MERGVSLFPLKSEPETQSAKPVIAGNNRPIPCHKFTCSPVRLIMLYVHSNMPQKPVCKPAAQRVSRHRKENAIEL
jgi:hypothetical protein